MLREWGVVELLQETTPEKLISEFSRSLPFYPTTRWHHDNSPAPRPKNNVTECQWSFKKKQTKASSRTSIPPKKKHLLMFVDSPSPFFSENKMLVKNCLPTCRESCHVSCNESSSWKMMDERWLVSCWVETWYLFHVFRTETTGTLKWKSITACILHMILVIYKNDLHICIIYINFVYSFLAFVYSG